MWSGRYVAAVTDRGEGLPPPEELLSISHTEVGDAVVVTVSGDVDVMTAPRLRQGLDAAFLQAADSAPVIVDLTEVSFLGSRGLRTLIDAHLQADRGSPLRVVVDATRPVIRPMQLSGTDQVLELFHSVEDAMAGTPETDLSS